MPDNTNLIKDALLAGDGVLRLAPCWVPRSFLMPGGRLKLDPRDLYALGAHRGGIDERWFSSTTNADNGPGTPWDEGLSYIAVDGQRVLLREGIESLGDQFLGADVMEREKGWNILCKFFDNLGPIPHHMHQADEHAAKVGQKGKPEAYYFPPQYNFTGNNFPYTFMGLEPGTTKDDVRRCLERWNEGDNGILDHSKAYRLKPGTGWQIDAGILHAPGSLVTYEPQVNSDVFGMFQSMVEGRAVPWDLLVKDVPKENHHDLDYIIGMLDWEKNVDPEFMAHRLFHPLPVKPEAEMHEAGYSEKWVAYSTNLYSAKELTVLPGRSATITDAAAYGLIVTQGLGTVGKMDVETPTLIRFGEMTKDELFVTAAAAKNGVKVTNRSDREPLVMLKHFGPGNPDAAPLSEARMRRAALFVAALLAGAATRPPDVPFQSRMLDAGANETCVIADMNGDGKADIVSGENWYEAPTWKGRRWRDLPYANNYIDAFSDHAIDVDGDGRLDIVTVSWFAKKLAWYRNPGKAGGAWTETVVENVSPIEFSFMVDLDNDGRANEVLPQFGDSKAPLAWYAVKNGNLEKHVASPRSYGHGIGAGDVNGDGKTDILTPKGWLEAPNWTMHEAWNEAQHLGFMFVIDINQDGKPDVLTSAAHDYGIFWLEQTPDGKFVKRMIDDSWSQPHALTLVDLNGDGRQDLLTGKRYMAHNGKDPGEREPLGLYWYEWRKNEKGQVDWVRHVIDYATRAGGGMQLAAADLDGDGDMDFVAPGKSGLFLFENLTKGKTR